ncbi:hypothetical protein, partial [Aeromonas veronii]|uniref:hypothetical protein n=1 Tax=Aeromonas veronii TaxID=654 RepID=UPI003D19336D
MHGEVWRKSKIVTLPVFDSFVKWIIQISLIDSTDESRWPSDAERPQPEINLAIGILLPLFRC